MGEKKERVEGTENTQPARTAHAQLGGALSKSAIHDTCRDPGKCFHFFKSKINF